jgi:hypothetical protein
MDLGEQAGKSPSRLHDMAVAKSAANYKTVDQKNEVKHAQTDFKANDFGALHIGRPDVMQR